MKKEDKLNLAFGKCFSKSRLTEAECEMLLDLNLLELMTKHGLNEVQSRKVMLWCQRECQRRNSPAYLPKEDTYEIELDLNRKYYRT
tara:strand:- start:1484 stop:1744 length:261 start_codon:yes stop_codon:yes gene_type:complete